MHETRPRKRYNRMIGLISEKYIGESCNEILIEEMDYCVYFITDGDCIKIGSAASLPNRIKQLQTGNPRKLRALYVINAKTQNDAIQIEKSLHKELSEKQIIGEWFDIKVLDIKKICHKLGYEPCVPVSKYDFDVDGILIIKT